MKIAEFVATSKTLTDLKYVFACPRGVDCSFFLVFPLLLIVLLSFRYRKLKW